MAENVSGLPLSVFAADAIYLPFIMRRVWKRLRGSKRRSRLINQMSVCIFDSNNSRGGFDVNVINILG